jgi:hypothetical protein
MVTTSFVLVPDGTPPRKTLDVDAGDTGRGGD